MRTLAHILIALFASLAVFAAYAEAKDDFIVVIDPGHGGKDAGCVGKIIKEKDLNLAVALRAGELIAARCPGVKVIYTRRTDTFVTLMGRTERANKAKADLFISIHADAIPRTRRDVEQTYGAGVFTLGTARNQENLDVAMRENRAILLEDNYESRYEGFDPAKPESYIIFEMMQNTHQTQSIEVASAIQRSLVKRGGRRNRDVRQAGFYVLRTAAMPAILIEVGFLSNTKEERWLATKEGKETIANAICLGFADYKKSWDSRNNVTSSQPTTAPPRPTKGEETKPSSDSSPKDRTSEDGADASSVVYKIQFLSSPKILKKGNAALKGLWPVSYYKEGRTYRYTYGEAKSKDELQNDMIRIRKKFKDAFVVTFDADGHRIK